MFWRIWNPLCNVRLKFPVLCLIWPPVTMKNVYKSSFYMFRDSNGYKSRRMEYRCYRTQPLCCGPYHNDVHDGMHTNVDGALWKRCLVSALSEVFYDSAWRFTNPVVLYLITSHRLTNEHGAMYPDAIVLHSGLLDKYVELIIGAKIKIVCPGGNPLLQLSV